MSIDLRAFEYELEPLRRQRVWRLDRSRATLARLQKAIDDASAEFDTRRAEHEAACRRASDAGAGLLDPAARRHLLAWLARSQLRLAQANQALTTLLDERRRAAAQCVEYERRLEVLERHRSQRLGQFVRDETARKDSEADREWLARAQPAGAPTEGNAMTDTECGA